MTYARVRDGNWSQLYLRTIENMMVNWVDELPEWVSVACFDSAQSGLYVLTHDGENHFTAQSIDLEFTEDKMTIDLPEKYAETILGYLGQLLADNKMRYSDIEALSYLYSALEEDATRDLTTGK